MSSSSVAWRDRAQSRNVSKRGLELGNILRDHTVATAVAGPGGVASEEYQVGPSGPETEHRHEEEFSKEASPGEDRPE
jgi:hypothetical protein